MSENEFLRQQQAAVQIMREMNSRAVNNNTNKNSPKASLSPPEKPPQNKSKPTLPQSGFDMPLIDLLKNGDTTLILGLLLLLFSENADKRLLFALIYILL